jgi:hypothetical protein
MAELPSARPSFNALLFEKRGNLFLDTHDKLDPKKNT